MREEFVVAEMEARWVWRHHASGTLDHHNIPPDLDDTACAAMFLLAATTTACNSIVEASDAISSVSFPREVIPLGAAASNLTERAIATCELAAVAVAEGSG